MRETTFIRQNQEKWAEYEHLLRQSHIDPDRLREMFVHVTDDLAYARTFYPTRTVRYYLNGLAQRIFHRLHYRRQWLWSRMFAFWTDRLPLLLWESRWALLLSFAIFVASAAVGVVSSRVDPDFARYILGDSYVEMTLENIEAGDPMAVYKEEPPLGMAIGIAANNVFVALQTTLSGVLSAIGTVFILVRNGIMVGVFQYFFIERGLFWPSFLTIWIHGTLEISAIIVAGAAGLVMGAGPLFPGTYARRQAFQRAARRAVYIFLGLIPLFLLAAFFEGFLTRYTDTPAALRLAFIGASLVFVLGYFVYLPWRKAQQRPFDRFDVPDTLPPVSEAISFVAIKSSGAVLVDVFRLFSRRFWLLVGSGATAAVLLVGSALWAGWLSSEAEGAERFNFSPLAYVKAMFFVGLALLSLEEVRRAMPADHRAAFAPVRGMPLVVFGVLLAGAAVVMGAWQQSTVGLVLRMAILGGICSVGLAALYFGRHAWSVRWRVLAPHYWPSLALIGISLAFFAVLLGWFFNSLLADMIVEFFRWLVPATLDAQYTYNDGIALFFRSLVLYLSWEWMIIAGALCFFSHREREEAAHLYQQIARVGSQKRLRGLTRE